VCVYIYIYIYIYRERERGAAARLTFWPHLTCRIVVIAIVMVMSECCPHEFDDAVRHLHVCIPCVLLLCIGMLFCQSSHSLNLSICLCFFCFIWLTVLFVFLFRIDALPALTSVICLVSWHCTVALAVVSFCYAVSLVATGVPCLLAIRACTAFWFGP